MARISDAALEDIRSRVDLAEFIGTRVTLKRVGATYKGCCPFHNEKTPSFTVNPQKGFYHCFGCGAHGDVFRFLMNYEGLTFMDAVKRLAEQTGVEIDATTDWDAQARARLLRIHAEVAAFYQRCLKTVRAAQIARDYLSARRLDADIIETFAIGYAPKGQNVLLRWAEKHNYAPEDLVSAGLLAPPGNARSKNLYFDRFQGRLMFPICDGQGRVIAFSGRILDNSHPAKYVNSPETEIFRKSNTLYGLHLARANIVKAARREAIVCEGQIDVIRCHAAGFNTAVASQGTAFTKEHVEILKRYADSVVLVFDGDAAGSKAALRTGALFLDAEQPVRVAILPEGEDPDSILRDKGPDVFQSILDQALSITAYQIRVLRKIEQNPTAVDAVQRMAHAVIETVAPCPGGVLRAHLLSEAAELLHLPVSALEEDLAAERKALDESQQRRELYARNREETLKKLNEEAPKKAPSLPHPVSDDAFIPDDGDTYAAFDGDFIDVPPGDESETIPQALPSLVGMEALSRLSLSLCELLVHHFLDKQVMDCVIHHLPDDLVTQPYARKTLQIVREAHRRDTHTLEVDDLLEEPDFQKFIAEISSKNSRMEYAREASPLTAIRDLVTRFWILSYRQQKQRLADDPDAVKLRVQLAESIKRLETQPWEAVAAYMDARNADRATVIVAPPSAIRPAPRPAGHTPPDPRPETVRCDPPPVEPEVEIDEPEDDFDLF